MSQFQRDFANSQNGLQALRAEQNPLVGSPLFERAQQEARADEQKLQALGLRTDGLLASDRAPAGGGIAPSSSQDEIVSGIAGGRFNGRTMERLDRPTAPVIPGFQNGTLFQQQPDGTYQRIDNQREPQTIYASQPAIDFMTYLTISQIPYQQALPLGVRIPPLPRGLEAIQNSSY